jgi:hypothetical protein
MGFETVGRVANLCYRGNNIHWFSCLNPGIAGSLICELYSTSGAVRKLSKEYRVCYMDNTCMPLRCFIVQYLDTGHSHTSVLRSCGRGASFHYGLATSLHYTRREEVG